MKIDFKKLAAVPLIFSLSVVSVYAMSFKDVTQIFWGYQYINDVAEKGLITADAEGYFKPNDNINKFDAAKILAKAAGYRYTNVTSEEKKYYDEAYGNYKNLLDKQSKNYSKWQTISDREISYLLEKNIFTQADLEKFIVKDAKTEKLRALSKEEAAVYLVRLIGDNVNLKNISGAVFADDSFISSDYKQYVYCLYKNRIITGDDNNKFNPKSAVTKTTMSVMLSKTLKFINDSKVQKVEAVSGTVDKVYSGISAIQIISPSGTKNIYKISSDCNITVDGLSKNLDAIKENMTIFATLNNSVIVSLEVKSYSNIPDINPGINLQSINAIVDSISNEPRAVNIKIQILNPAGGITTEIKKYILADNCKISRENYPINLSNISSGEIIKIDFDNSVVYAISIVDKNRKISGTLLEKKCESGNIFLIIRDSNNEKYELKVVSDTLINRKNNGRISWSDLKVGDKITASCEYSNLVEVYAEGESSTKEGWIEEVKIFKDGSAVIKIKDTDNLVKDYNVSVGKVDVYSLRVNTKVKMNIDSNEIESVIVIDKSETNYFGEVLRIFDNTTLRIKADSGNEIEIQCNKNTKFKNVNGNETSISEIYRGDKIYIVMNDDSSSYAKTVTVVYTK